jgi:hypothetical protein
MREFSEGNALTVTVRFRASNEAVIPTTAHYKLVNITADTTVVDWTSVVPDAEIEIDLSAIDLRVSSRNRRYEIFEITAVSDKDTADQAAKAERFKLKNLNAIS